ncbi:MAG: NAD(P)-binding domain-containing protein [Nitrospiraceae bacterium]|nr:NAD(P)-binding domain-containing protein [Nitrospiraceae bacterium]
MFAATRKLSFAIIGAGCGGQAIAGYLSLRGHDVALYNRSHARIASFQNRGSIELCDKLNGSGTLSYIGTDLAEAIADRDIIMVVTTATAHRSLAQKMVPHLRDGQLILLNPGRTFGALEVSHTLRKAGCTADVVVGEANTLVYVARALVPGTAVVKAIKKSVFVSAVLAADTSYLMRRLRGVYPQFTAAASFLETSFGNIGAVLHPTVTLLNKDRILSKIPFDFYRDGITREVARYLERIDRERLAMAAALGGRPLSVSEWVSSRYGLGLADIYTMLRSNPYYRNVKAPTTLDHRYLLEDVPTGLVPISDAASAVGVRTPAMDHLIDEASGILGRDFRKEGRTLDNLGLPRYRLQEALANIIAGNATVPKRVHVKEQLVSIVTGRAMVPRLADV